MSALLTILPLLFTLQTAEVKTKRGVYIEPVSIYQYGNWRIEPGENTVTVGGDEVRIAQREPRNTTQYASAKKNIRVGARGKWRVSFEIKMGQLGTVPTAVGLYSGRELIGWVGADNYYKKLGVCFGKDYFDTMDNSIFPFADTEWHTISFSCMDGETITIRRDGKTVARTSSTLRPDQIQIGQIHVLFGMEPANRQQSELTLRRLWVEAGDML